MCNFITPAKKRDRRTFLVAAAGGVLASSFGTAAFAKEDTPASLAQLQVNLIDCATRERVLVQRLARLYVQFLAGARTSDAKRLISDSISRFDSINAKHNGIVEGTESSSITFDLTKALRNVNQDWPKLRAVLLRTPTEKNLSELIVQIEALSKQINQSSGASDMFLNRSPIGQLMGISGKQCYISQRIAMYYFLKVLKHKPEEANQEIARLVGDFEYNKASLEKGKENSTEIKFLLQLAGTQWPYFKEAVNAKQRTDASQHDYNVATAAENMLEVLDRTNLLYYKLMLAAG